MKLFMPIEAIEAGKSPEDLVISSRFGRAAYLVAYETETEMAEVIENHMIHSEHGAGIGTAQTVVDGGGQVVLSGRLGPKALKVLKASNIACYEISDVTVAVGIQQFLDGALKEII